MSQAVSENTPTELIRDGETFGGWNGNKLPRWLQDNLAPFKAEHRAERLQTLLSELLAARPILALRGEGEITDDFVAEANAKSARCEALTHAELAATYAYEIGWRDGHNDQRRPGEPMFILLARDPDAHNIVRVWAERRLAAGGGPEHCAMGLETAFRMKEYAADPTNAPKSAPPASAYPQSVGSEASTRIAELEAALKAEFDWHEREWDCALDGAREATACGTKADESLAMERAKRHGERMAIIHPVLAFPKPTLTGGAS